MVTWRNPLGPRRQTMTSGAVRTSHGLSVRVLVAAVLLTVSLAAHGSSSAAATLGTTESTKTATVKSVGIAFEYPDDWVVFALTKRDVKRQSKALAKANPKLAKDYLREAQLEALKNMEFSAGDLEAKLAGLFAANMSVTLTSAFPPSLEAFEADLSSQLSELGGSVLDARTVDVSGETGYRAVATFILDAPDGTSLDLRIGMLIIERSGRGVLVSVGGLDDEASAQTIDDVLASVRLL